ncbi:MAG: molybdenum cofactor biosynthesis protein C [Candidatus Schekmanbacteria bacterium RBG_13_48_7]|uniref:cyclic pyranopterin monophosphate synthase n=1 Tax=Candidatus Schekmanbacteria bacterium RBG_13_48_7 TaxID=1817878 RepID=A0A1F7RTD9_9BACT|nr:MAG: molybdenum cofactor biosynthesis protein C [Candidatus Schekmanbacteria bacterium RBG_13_48_7]
MVDISRKKENYREAVARGSISISKDVLDMIIRKKIPKGDVLTTAKIAAITAGKRTADLIPLCHPIPVTHIEITLTPDIKKSQIEITSTIRTRASTGVEMEALTAVVMAGLCIYDMCKPFDKTMVIGNIRLMRKIGGKSGLYERHDEN